MGFFVPFADRFGPSTAGGIQWYFLVDVRNLKYMRALAQACPTPAIVQQAVAQLPWSHIVTLLDKLEEPDARNWYAAQSLEHGWSRNVLAMQIDPNVRLQSYNDFAGGGKKTSD